MLSEHFNTLYLHAEVSPQTTPLRVLSITTVVANLPQVTLMARIIYSTLTIMRLGTQAVPFCFVTGDHQRLDILERSSISSFLNAGVF